VRRRAQARKQERFTAREDKGTDGSTPNGEDKGTDGSTPNEIGRQ